jgi:hypothetical protein
MVGPVLAAEKISFEANGHPYTPFPEPIVDNGVLLVPVSAVTDMLDIEAKCNLKDNTITLG